ncbi:hypothetical protein HUS23_00395 [Ectothiorhodospiraceae bacterium 2226]|nr:hypothetical protein HUS23_00395 [Ectothiorhodospiraceae bacterium 2226]
MSSNTYAAPLRLEWRPCPRTALVLGAVHLGALAAVGASALPLGLKALAIVLVGWSLVRVLRRHAWPLAPDAVVALDWDAEDRWWLHTRAGSVLEGRLLPEVYVSAGLVVLPFKTAAGPRSVLLHPGRVEGEGLRRLRVRLRISAPSPAGDSSAV